MSSLPCISILLSTYNGELYIREQLDSIFRQTYKQFKLYVRDDASSDNTESILAEYKAQLSDEDSEKLIIIRNDEKENWGYMDSFWFLLRECGKADYYAFCDQDDVWESDKLERGIHMLGQQNREIPLLYTSRFDYCASDMKFQKHCIKYPYKITFDKVAFYTPAFGFTIIINQKLRHIALQTKDLKEIPHDAWCLKIAAGLGKVIYDESITAKYRRHEATVTYASASKFVMIRRWFQNDVLKNGLNERYYMLKHFKEEYGSLLSLEQTQFIELFDDQKVSVIKRIRRVFYAHRLRPTLGSEIALRICFVVGK